MASNSLVTLDHINNYFSLTGRLEPLNIAPTATGGAGINNIEEYPPPKPCVSVAKQKDIAYVDKYLNKAKAMAEIKKFQASNLTLGSTSSVNDLEDVEDASTVIGDLPELSELDSERTQQLYSTYYSVPDRKYDLDLNVTNHREEILQHLNINPVVIIQGPTGCGKTTQVPQFILDYHAAKGKYCNIIVTQPRKIAAISIARRVCQERGWQLGTIVGYQVAMDPNVSADTRLCYVTTGVLLEKLVSAKSMDKYTHVIIDEVHERDQEIDFALLLVKKFLLTNSQRVKVLLMSATFDTAIFAEYFSLSLKGDFAPVIDITGKTKEVTEHYLHELKTLISVMPEFDQYAPTIDPCLYDTVIQLMYVFDRIEKAEQNVPAEADYAPSRGAVLIFLPGYEEIATLRDKLTMARFNKKFWVIPLHSTITVAEQNKVFQTPPPDNRKVILSTNIAESSITVPDVKYVIDFCLTKSLVTDPNTNYTCLQLEWASKANCTQRKGRAGRVDIGKVYRMVPKYFYEQFVEYSIPEIKRCPLTRTILHLKRLDVCEPQEMLAFALDPPYLLDIENAILQLKEALALYGKGSTQDGNLTFIGNVMASLPLDIKLSKLILFGYAFSCLEDCIIIAASLSLQSFFARPFQEMLKSYRSRLAWAQCTFSDCFAYLNAYQDWKRKSAQSYFLRPGGLKERDWGEKNYIQIRRIKEVDKLVKEIRGRLEKHNIYVDSHNRDSHNPTSDMILKIVIAGAFFPHYFLQERLDEKQVLREVNDNDPLSTVVVSGLPPNHGLLYACALRDMFTCCSDKIDIDFEERKAYIKFGKEETSSMAEELKMPALSVNLPVYLAVKMRLLRLPLELSVFSYDEAESKMMQIKQLKKSSSDRMLASNRYSVKLKPASTLQRINFPPTEAGDKIFITHAHNCGHFWARRMNSSSSNELRFIEYTIFNIQKEKGLKPLDRRPEVNYLCLAPYKEERNVQYYRGQVRDVKDGKVKIHFIDYGNEEEVNEEDLREICDTLPDVITTAPLAFECYLSEVKPSSGRHYLGVWSDAANSWFKKTISGKVLNAKIYSVVQDTVRLELRLETPNGMIMNINEKLISMGFAVKAEESLASKQNHEYRMNCLNYSNNMITASGQQESGFHSMELSLEEAIGFSNIRTTSSKIRLRGPSNPLEVSYVGMTHVDRSKCVKIERESVNSVSFNAEPQDVCPSMIVAASLTIGQVSDSVSARNTTLMPKILGLPSLICLMFAPCAEIRTDKGRTSYTGAVCGLGFDLETRDPLYSDHDMEIEFDTEITLEDICDINAIRMGVNMLLQDKDETKTNVLKYRKVLRECIIKLIQKKRTPREPCFYSKTGQWNQVPSTMLLQPEVDVSVDNPHVLPLHKPPSLEIRAPVRS